MIRGLATYVSEKIHFKGSKIPPRLLPLLTFLKIFLHTYLTAMSGYSCIHIHIHVCIFTYVPSLHTHTGYYSTAETADGSEYSG